MGDLQKKYEGRVWLKAYEVREITKLSNSTLARCREREIIRSKRPYDGGNFQYSYDDVKKIMGWS